MKNEEEVYLEEILDITEFKAETDKKCEKLGSTYQELAKKFKEQETFNSYSQNDIIIGMSEAYQVYMLIPNKLKKIVPKDLVNKMKNNYKENIGSKIESFTDINSDDLSEEGLMIISYIRELF